MPLMIPEFPSIYSALTSHYPIIPVLKKKQRLDVNNWPLPRPYPKAGTSDLEQTKLDTVPPLQNKIQWEEVMPGCS